ncbi:hypothetical protein BV20DRAFT_577742 [Pilatotrama ljubarskyi]|nr:hypothetical protein BV20DRAFT_577742 [Pilatotrama ljubarskyi]
MLRLLGAVDGQILNPLVGSIASRTNSPSCRHVSCLRENSCGWLNESAGLCITASCSRPDQLIRDSECSRNNGTRYTIFNSYAPCGSPICRLHFVSAMLVIWSILPAMNRQRKLTCSQLGAYCAQTDELVSLRHGLHHPTECALLLKWQRHCIRELSTLATSYGADQSWDPQKPYCSRRLVFPTYSTRRSSMV